MRYDFPTKNFKFFIKFVKKKLLLINQQVEATDGGVYKLNK